VQKKHENAYVGIKYSMRDVIRDDVKLRYGSNQCSW